MPHQSSTDRCKIHMKNLKKIREKKRIEEVKKYGPLGKPLRKRNLKSELISAIWDIDAKQYPRVKKGYLKKTVALRLEETNGVETDEIVKIKERIKRYWE